MQPTAPPDVRLFVAAPRAALALDPCRHIPHLCVTAFAWQLRERLSDRLGYLVIADVTDRDRFEIAPGIPRDQTIDRTTIETVDATVDELLAAPEQWHHARGWAPRWEAPDPWDPWYQTGSATWGDVTVRFTIAVKQGSYALLVGYQAEGDEKWKRYRCHFPAARSSADAIGHAIARSIGVWLAYRWPEGPCENP